MIIHLFGSASGPSVSFDHQSSLEIPVGRAVAHPWKTYVGVTKSARYSAVVINLSAHRTDHTKATLAFNPSHLLYWEMAYMQNDIRSTSIRCKESAHNKPAALCFIFVRLTPAAKSTPCGNVGKRPLLVAAAAAAQKYTRVLRQTATMGGDTAVYKSDSSHLPQVKVYLCHVTHI